jgi:hypothetical protein
MVSLASPAEPMTKGSAAPAITSALPRLSRHSFFSSLNIVQRRPVSGFFEPRSIPTKVSEEFNPMVKSK